MTTPTTPKFCTCSTDCDVHNPKSAAVDAALPVQELEELAAKALDLKERMRVNRHEVHGGCCDDTPDHAVPCASPVCAIEYEAEVLLGELSTALLSTRAAGGKP